MKTGMTLFLKKGRKLTVQDQGYARHRQLVAGLSTRRPGFDCWPVHVMFVVDKVALEQVFFPRVPRVSRAITQPIYIHIKISLIRTSA